MSNIVITRPIPAETIDQLRQQHSVTVHEDWLMNEQELQEFVKGADILVCLLTDPVTDAVMEAAGPQLKLIASYNVGFDNIDLEAAARRGITVTNTPGVISGPAVAEHAMALMFAAARWMVPGDRYMRAGKYHGWEPNLLNGQLLTGKTVGIIGTGQIGSIFAAMCHQALKMNVVYYDVQANERLEKEVGAKKLSLEELLAQADVVSVHVPLLPSTHNLIGAEQLCLMKPTAILINTARGPIIEEQALVQALRYGQIYAAGLDVYAHEPLLTHGLTDLDNVVLTPHIASATEDTRQGMAEAVLKNIEAFLKGEPVPNAVKPPEKK